MSPEELAPLLGPAGTPVVVGLTEVAKRAAPIPRRFAPLLALAIAIGWNVWIATVINTPPAIAATFAVLTGLAACGLYSGVKATITPSDSADKADIEDE